MKSYLTTLVTMLQIYRNPLLWSACLGGMTMASPVAAANRDKPREIEEIVVTSHQQNRTIQETQHSVDLFSSDALELSTYRSFDELVASRPNMEIDARSGEIIVRGTPVSGYGGLLPTQLNLVDGAYTPGIIHFWDVQQIEILKGAQSSAGSSVGGTFAAKYNPATLEPSASLMVNYAPATNNRELGLHFGNALVPDNLAFRVSAYGRSSDGYIDNVLRDEDDWASFDEQFYRTELKWFIDETSEIYATLLYLETEEGGREFVNLVDTDGTPVYSEKTAIDGDEFDRESKRDFVVHYRKEFESGVRLHAVFNDHRWRQLRLLDDLASTDTSINRFTQNNRVTGGGFYLDFESGGWEHSGVAYSFLFDINFQLELFLPVDLDGAGPLPGITNRFNFELDSQPFWSSGLRLASTYQQERWSFTAKATVTNSRASQKLEQGFNISEPTGVPAVDAIYERVLGGFLPAPVIAREDTSETLLNPGLSVSYDITPDVTVGILWEQAHRQGWIDVNGFQGLAVPYDAELADEFNLSVRARLLDANWVLNGNLFYTDFVDTQLNFCESSAPLDCATVNAGESHRAGLELTSDYYWNNWHLNVAISRLEGEFDTFDVPGFDNQLEADLPNSPDWKVFASISYRSNNGFFASLDYTARPETIAQLGVIGGRPVPDINEKYHVMNARVGYSFRNSQVSLWARNLTDEEYYSRFEARNRGGFIAAPRELGVTIRSSW